MMPFPLCSSSLTGMIAQEQTSGPRGKSSQGLLGMVETPGHRECDKKQTSGESGFIEQFI